MLDRFRENHLLFVFADNELTDVVHFSDYNRSAVSEYLYGLLSDFEKALRDILVSQKLKNSHMAEYFVERIDSTSRDEKKKYKRKLKAYNDHRGASDNLPHFQTFYLIDLIELLAARNIMQVSDAVNDLRNMIMHAHELVHLENVNADDFIYDFASFETFFNRVMVLQDHYRKAVNKLAFSTVD